MTSSAETVTPRVAVDPIGPLPPALAPIDVAPVQARLPPRAATWLMLAAFVLSQAAALPDALFAFVWIMLLGRGVVDGRPGLIRWAAVGPRCAGGGDVVPRHRRHAGAAAVPRQGHNRARRPRCRTWRGCRRRSAPSPITTGRLGAPLRGRPPGRPDYARCRSTRPRCPGDPPPPARPPDGRPARSWTASRAGGRTPRPSPPRRARAPVRPSLALRGPPALLDYPRAQADRVDHPPPRVPAALAQLAVQRCSIDTDPAKV